MKLSVFEYKHYRDYLQVRFPTTGASRGIRSRLAEKIHTKPAFVSQVFSGSMDLSPEHIPPTNALLQHTAEEGHFFTLLVLAARAGTPDLEKYYREQMKEILKKRENYLANVTIKETVSDQDQALYYSQWYYSAIHMLTGVAHFQTREAMSERLDLPLQIVSTALDDLMRMGLVEKKSGKFTLGKNRIHLEKSSPWLSQFHSHYRNRAMQRLVAPEASDFHFTSGMCVSSTVMEELRRKFLEVLTELEPKIAKAKEEDLFAVNIDLFRF